MRVFLRFWFPLLAYSAIIFVISSLPAKEIAFTAVVWDKLLHLTEYGVWGFLYARALASTKRFDFQAIWVLSVVFCYLYGLSDEFHQSFTPGRDSSLGDALADLIGGALGSGICLFIQQQFNKKEVVPHVSA